MSINLNINKKNRILIIGFGSIGKRHYNNLVQIGYKNISVFDIDSNSIPDGVDSLDRLDLKSIGKFEVVLICNPNNLHISTAQLCAEAGCHLFIEKPLSNDFGGIQKLQETCEEKGLINMIACNYRFHPCLEYIRKYIEENNLGKVYKIIFDYGYYLPYWRKEQDYRKNYAASKSKGGGITLDGGTHLIDILFWFNNFIEVESYMPLKLETDSLEIETEDVYVGIFKFKNNMIGTVSCDYLQKKYTNTCKVIGENGNLEWNFCENTVRIFNEDGAINLFSLEAYDANMMYIEEIKYFFNCIKEKKETFNNIEKARLVLSYCL